MLPTASGVVVMLCLREARRLSRRRCVDGAMLASASNACMRVCVHHVLWLERVLEQHLHDAFGLLPKFTGRVVMGSCVQMTEWDNHGPTSARGSVIPAPNPDVCPSTQAGVCWDSHVSAGWTLVFTLCVSRRLDSLHFRLGLARPAHQA